MYRYILAVIVLQANGFFLNHTLMKVTRVINGWMRSHLNGHLQISAANLLIRNYLDCQEDGGRNAVCRRVLSAIGMLCFISKTLKKRKLLEGILSLLFVF